jgi:hypothetical protein
MGHKAEWASGAAGPIRAKTKREILSEMNKIFEFMKALQICTRRFRRNFDVVISPKLF